jgi:hypothetical protein
MFAVGLRFRPRLRDSNGFLFGVGDALLEILVCKLGGAWPVGGLVLAVTPKRSRVARCNSSPVPSSLGAVLWPSAHAGIGDAIRSLLHLLGGAIGLHRSGERARFGGANKAGAAEWTARGSGRKVLETAAALTGERLDCFVAMASLRPFAWSLTSGACSASLGPRL